MTTRKMAVTMTLAFGVVAAGLWAPARADENHFTIGSQWWSQTAREAKFEEFREVPRGGFLENFLWSTWSGRNSLTMWGVNGLRDDQATRLTLANGAKWRLDLGYQEIPHLFSEIARSPYTQVLAGVWVLPDSLQYRNQTGTAAGYTARMTDVLNGAPNIPLKFATDVSRARLRARPARGWQFEARATMRERSGVKPYAMTFGFNTAIEIPEPIQQQMVDGDLIANYQKNQFKLMASGGVSTFVNKVSTLFVDNPKRVTDVAGGDGPKVGALDLYPDNHVIRGSLAMAYLLPQRTSLAGTFGWSRSTQDDPFLKPLNNSALQVMTPGPPVVLFPASQSTLDSLPARSLKGKADQLSGDVRLTSSPTDKLDGALRFHYTKYDNKTPALNFTGFAPYDVSWQRRIYTESDPVGNSQWVGGLDLDYSLTHAVRVGGTAEYRVRERTFREIEKDKETVLGARARLRPMDAVQIDGKYTHGDRKHDAFNPEDYLGYTTRLAVPVTGIYDSLIQVEQPGLRRYDVADRVQDKATAGLSWGIGERADLSGTYAYVKNDYTESTFGLNDDKDHTVAAAGTFHASDRLDLNAGYGFDWTRSNQTSRQSGTGTLSSVTTDNWTAELSDKDVFVQTGFDWDVRPGTITLLGDYQFSRHQAKFHFTNGTNTAQDVPNTMYRLQQLVAETQYHWQKATTVSVRYGWEEYDTDDWAVTNVPLLFPVTGTASAVFLGNSAQSYRAHRAALLLRHTF